MTLMVADPRPTHEPDELEPATPRRYPIQPLLNALALHPTHTGGGNQPGTPEGHALLALHLGISHRHARRLATHGLNDTQADRYACRIGHHPATLWTNWWDIEPDTEEDPTTGIMS